MCHICMCQVAGRTEGTTSQQQETALYIQIVQRLKEKVRKQSKQLNELRLQLEMRQFKVSIYSSSYNSK